MQHRFSVDSPLTSGATAHLTGDELHHAVRVRRIRPGEMVEIFDPSGRGWEARVESVSPDDVSLEVLRPVPSRESALELTLGLSLIKPEKFELALQKCTELGVARFIPVLSERVQVRTERIEKKYDRWERIIEEAVKQSGRAVPPELLPPVPFETIVGEQKPRFILDADAEDVTLGNSHSEVILLIGPEGGFTPEELSLSADLGCVGLRLGPRRLRAETAAIAAVTLFQHRWGDLGN